MPTAPAARKLRRLDAEVSRGGRRREPGRTALSESAIANLADRRARSLARLQQRAEQFERFLQANQWVLPLESYDITATFGASSSLWSASHTGLDFAAPEGTGIRAVSAGTVSESGYSGAYGNRTVIRTDDGTEFWYCHQSSVSVATGEQVEAGQEIGAVGSTGNVTGSHLHLEIRPFGGAPVDPRSTMGGEGVTP